MPKLKYRKKINLILPAAALVFVFGTLSAPIASADRYDQQIRELRQLNRQNESARNGLAAREASLAGKLRQLQAEIAGLERQLAASQTKHRQLKKRIAAVRRQIAQQKELLRLNVRALYVEGDVTTLEMLVSSQNISDYFDREQYRMSIQDNINTMLDEIAKLEKELQAKKVKVEKMIKDQKAMQVRLSAQRAEQNRLLSMNRSQQSRYEAKISSNNARITELRRQQAAENAQLSGGYTAGTGVNCGGGYPGSTPGPWGSWGCNYPIDYAVDSWGMYNRQCVSYTAFRVANSGRHMPYWGGRGNANLWDDNARAAGIPVDYSPRKGDVAVSNSGYYGHVMYVEQVSGDGSIYVSDYNQQWDGRYRAYWISGSTVRARGLVFIHF